MNNASRSGGLGLSSGWIALVILLGSMWQVSLHAGLSLLIEAEAMAEVVPGRSSTLGAVTAPLSPAMLPERDGASFFRVERLLKVPGEVSAMGPVLPGTVAAPLRPVRASALRRGTSVPDPYHVVLHVYRC